MHSTKTEILALLKRSDGATVDDLAVSLGLAAMTVRQHLVALERDDLVGAEAVRRTTGRPHYSYRLTEEGHRRIAQGYDRLVELLVESAGKLEAAAIDGQPPENRRALLFKLAASALADRHRSTVRSLPPRDRGERIAEILRSYGGFSDCHQNGDGFELRDFNCVFRTTGRGDGPCEWHETLLVELTGTAPQTIVPSDDCVACCRYIIATPAAAVVESRSGA
jgi:predicted ArsR family transcriptional regulator